MKNNIHTFVLITQGEGKPGEYQFKTLFTTRNQDAVDELSELLLERNAGFKRKSMTRNAREVVVVHVDEQEAKKWIEEPGRNGLSARPTKRGQVFLSGAEASGHIGLRNNEVAMLLSRSTHTGEKRATLRGVTFAYKDEAAASK